MSKNVDHEHTSTSQKAFRPSREKVSAFNRKNRDSTFPLRRDGYIDVTWKIDDGIGEAKVMGSSLEEALETEGVQDCYFKMDSDDRYCMEIF